MLELNISNKVVLSQCGTECIYGLLNAIISVKNTELYLLFNQKPTLN